MCYKITDLACKCKNARNSGQIAEVLNAGSNTTSRIHAHMVGMIHTRGTVPAVVVIISVHAVVTATSTGVIVTLPPSSPWRLSWFINSIVIVSLQVNKCMKLLKQITHFTVLKLFLKILEFVYAKHWHYNKWLFLQLYYQPWKCLRTEHSVVPLNILK